MLPCCAALAAEVAMADENQRRHDELVNGIAARYEAEIALATRQMEQTAAELESAKAELKVALRECIESIQALDRKDAIVHELRMKLHKKNHLEALTRRTNRVMAPYVHVCPAEGDAGRVLLCPDRPQPHRVQDPDGRGAAEKDD
jgi:septal ring factor EnvC (AmiA/AmiB activator)